MVKRTIIMLMFFSIHLNSVLGQISKANPQNDKFFITNGDTIWYHSKYTWYDSDVDWLMNERTHLHALVDTNLNVLTDFKYNSFFAFYRGYNSGVACRNGKWGLVNKKGEEVTEFKYSWPFTSYLDSTTRKEFFVFMKGKKKGVIDGNGNVVIPFKWKSLVYRGYGIYNLSKGKKNNLYYVKTGEFVPINNYSLLHDFNRFGKSVLEDLKSGKYGVIDTSGTIIQPCIYNREKDVEKFLK